MKRVGLYGGMFDPIHVGHLGLSLALKEAGGLDEIWFCPAACSPHKTGHPATPALHRLRMVELAVAPIPGTRVVETEIDRPLPSYTIETVRSLVAAHPDCTFSLLLGSDSLARLEEWADIEELVQLAPPLIGRRSYKVTLPHFESALLRKACEKGRVDSPLIEVSSSELRPRLRGGDYCGHLIPAPSYHYLLENRIYQGLVA